MRCDQVRVSSATCKPACDVLLAEHRTMLMVQLDYKTISYTHASLQ